MNGLKVATFKGVDIYYNSRSKDFHIDMEGEKDQPFESQVTAEKKITSLLKSKQERIPIYEISRMRLRQGELTSYNPDAQEVWVRWDKTLIEGGYGYCRLGREKFGIQFGHSLYAITDNNTNIVQEILKKNSQIDAINEEIKALHGELDSNINVDYFKKEEKDAGEQL